MIKDFLQLHGEYFDDKSFKDLTTVKIGGLISNYLLVNSVDDLKEVINYLKANKIAFKIIGNGSNLVCGEDTYDGVVISLKKLNNYEINNTSVYVEAGVMAPMLANTLARQGLSGLEFASGIPGTIGGLVYMNAGAYKSSMSAVVEKVLILKNDELVWMNNDELEFSYRHSILQDHPRWIVVAAVINLSKKDPELILDLMNDRLTRRKASQPLDMPSCGSSFRNPENDFAWKYIDQIGYRGYKVNGAMVSEKHSNFIVNVGGATASDYLTIAYNIIDTVKEKYGIKLVMEVEKFNC